MAMKVLAVSLVLGLFAGATTQDDLPAKAQRLENERRSCRANMMTLANANMAFRVKYMAGFTTNPALLEEFLAERPACPRAGIYSIVVGVPDNAFTVHCTILSHDAGAIQPAGFSPGVNTDYDNVPVLERLGQKDPARATCRANLATLCNAEVAQKVSHGAFVSDFTLLKEWLATLPICPEGGQYTAVVGVPKNSFTVHCSIKRHDAGMVEPKGYSPGRNRE